MAHHFVNETDSRLGSKSVLLTHRLWNGRRRGLLRELWGNATHTLSNTGRNVLKCLLPTYLPTHLSKSMEQIPSWEANRFSASQEILCTLRNPKIHYDMHERPPHVTGSTQSMPPHPTSLILYSHLRLGLPSGLLPSGLPTKTLYALLL